MAQITLLPQTGSGGVGNAFNIGTAVTQVNIECSPLANTGFSGTIFIEGSTAPSPGAHDWFTLVELDFTNHSNIVDFNLFIANNPWIRANMKTAGTLGSVAVYAAY